MSSHSFNLILEKAGYEDIVDVQCLYLGFAVIIVFDGKMIVGSHVDSLDRIKTSPECIGGMRILYDILARVVRSKL